VPRFSTHVGRRIVTGIPTVWLIVLFLIPFIIVFKISFSEVRLAMPPVAPLFEFAGGKLVEDPTGERLPRAHVDGGAGTH